MKDTMNLKNGTVIELEAGASLRALQVAAADRAAMVATWEALTPDNLAAVQIKTGDGTVAGNYTDLVLVSETSVVAADGAVLTTYSLREKTAEEKRLDALEASQAVQDGAIGDLGEAVGTLSEGGTV
ncbi:MULTISPECIES: hypothetical protein [Hungatella]|uniref:hypothetical protein n=1 Tax=Hungatella TaxID=1649459 RepID=UPI002672A9E6|nr:hypothetical protein [Hungatella hathewayi]